MAKADTDRLNVSRARDVANNVVGTDRQCVYECNGKRCRRISLKVSKYCYTHKYQDAKFRVHKKRPVPGKHTSGNWNFSMAFYNRRLGPKLAAYVKENLEAPLKEQRQVYNELALLRVSAGDAVQMYSAALEAQDSPTIKPEAKQDLLIQTGLFMRQMLDQVIRTAKIASEIEAAGKDKFSANDLHDVVNQLVHIVKNSFDAYPEAIEQFDLLLSTELKLPTINANGEYVGTTITPDQDVLDMDNSVPII